MKHIDINSEEFKCDNYERSLKLIKLTKLSPIDTKYLPLLESAIKGNQIAIGELADAFSTGNIKGIPANYTWAKLFADTIHDTSIEQAEFNPGGMVLSYRNIGLTERSFGKFDEAIECFRNAIKFMADKMKPEEWDFGIHELLQETIEQKWQAEGHG